MMLFLTEPLGVSPDGDLEAGLIQMQGLEESPTLTIPRLTIHKVVSRIYTWRIG